MLQLNKVKIVDLHAHFPATLVERNRFPHPRLAEYHREREARMAAEWDHGVAEAVARTPEQEEVYAERWAQEVDQYQLARVNFVTGSSHANLARMVRRYPRHFTGMVAVNPAQPDALDVLKRGVEELGLWGLKWFGPRTDVALHDPALRPLWQYMADKKMFALIHFGMLGKAGGVVYHRNMSPLTLYPVASEFLDIDFVVPHFGCGYMEDLLQLCWALPNIHVDTSGSNQWMRWVPYPMDLETAFRKYYETIGPERILFGSDSSWFPRGFAYRYLQDQLRACYYLGFREDEVEQIFSRNAARLLRLPQEAIARRTPGTAAPA